MPPKDHKQIQKTKPSFLEALRSDQRMLTLFLALLAFCFLSKLPRLGVPKDFYFDEVYHAYTATLYLDGDKKAYDPWATPAEGKGIEWTHPPLSKLIMAGSMAVIGKNGTGWRIGSVIFGTAASAMAAVFAFELFGSVSIAVLTLGLLSMETLIFAQSRIAMNDSYFIFFMLFALTFYVRWKRAPATKSALYLTGLGLGLALATKWTGLYLFMIIFADLFGELIWKARYPKQASIPHVVAAFCAVPFLAYLSSYSQFFSWGAGWDDFVKLQNEMWRYHTNLSATHAYTSKPWQWILNIKPVWMAVDYAVPGKVGHIYNIGNSVIFYTGLFAVFAMLFREKKIGWSWEKWFIALVYFALWVPWMFSPRIMLFYHYMPAVPALCIILARWLDRAFRNGRAMTAKAVLAGAFAWMILAYPFLTEVHVPKAIGDRFYSLFETK